MSDELFEGEKPEEKATESKVKIQDGFPGALGASASGEPIYEFAFESEFLKFLLDAKGRIYVSGAESMKEAVDTVLAKVDRCRMSAASVTQRAADLYRESLAEKKDEKESDD